MNSRFLKRPLLAALLTASVISIMLLGGCPLSPVPQTPDTLDTTNDDQSSTQTDDTQSDDSTRPIPSPDLDDDDDGTSGGTDNGGTDNGGTDTGGGTAPAGKAYLGFSQPFNAATVRPPATTDLVFNLAIDFGTSVASAQFIMARDDNSDHVADGAPVYSQALSVVEGTNKFSFNTQVAVDEGLLTDGFGKFLLGVRVTTTDGPQTLGYAPGTIGIDSQAPTATWNGAGSPPTVPVAKADNLVNRDLTWQVMLTTTDNSPHTVRIVLDPDTSPDTGDEFEFIKETVSAGQHSFEVPLLTMPAGTFYYYVTVSDGMDPPYAFYAPKTGGGFSRLAITNRLVGDFDLETLTDSHSGAILQGFNFNDLAGSSMVSVPDLDGDGVSELLVGARFGKPNLTSFNGQGWGEAYLIYGKSSRLRGTKELNSVGTSIPGLTFRGIRSPLNTVYTEGLSDIAVVDDMDGDDLPEIVFSFPRTESICLGATSPAIQHPELVPDIGDMGTLEYDAYYGMVPMWHPHESQFTRGGIVVVSSHNAMLSGRQTVTRKFDRVLDLHEVGQMFSWMKRPALAPYIWDIQFQGAGLADCEGDGTADEEYTSWAVEWDVWFGGA